MPPKSKRQELRDKRRRQQRNQRFLVIGLISVAAIALVALLIFTNRPVPVGEVVVPTFDVPTQVDMNSMGDPNAPVKIVEYFDFQCPYCADFWKTTESELINQYVKTGKVYFTARSMGNFISNNITRQTGGSNTESQDAAQAAYCAGDQGKYWQYYDMLFANQAPENSGGLGRNHLDAFAEKIGLDMTTFDSCLNSNKYLSKVNQDGVDGQAAITSAPNYDGSGVGTPSFLVNGTLLSGAQPISAFQKIIDPILSTQTK